MVLGRNLANTETELRRWLKWTQTWRAFQLYRETGSWKIPHELLRRRLGSYVTSSQGYRFISFAELRVDAIHLSSFFFHALLYHMLSSFLYFFFFYRGSLFLIHFFSLIYSSCRIVFRFILFRNDRLAADSSFFRIAMTLSRSLHLNGSSAWSAIKWGIQFGEHGREPLEGADDAFRTWFIDTTVIDVLEKLSKVRKHTVVTRTLRNRHDFTFLNRQFIWQKKIGIFILK